MTWQDICVGFGLVLAIEGALYGLFPESMRKAVVVVLAMPAERLRFLGLAMATVGVGLIWLVRRIL